MRLSGLSVLAALALSAGAQRIIGGDQVAFQDNVQSQAQVTVSWGWNSCGTPADKLHIESVEFDPDPPYPGNDEWFDATGRLDVAVENGTYADVTVRLGLIRLLQQRFDICEELRNANTTIQCPIPKGFHRIQQNFTIPEEVPRARYTIDAVAYSSRNEPLTCVNVFIDWVAE